MALKTVPQILRRTPAHGQGDWDCATFFNNSSLGRVTRSGGSYQPTGTHKLEIAAPFCLSPVDSAPGILPSATFHVIKLCAVMSKQDHTMRGWALMLWTLSLMALFAPSVQQRCDAELFEADTVSAQSCKGFTPC